MRFISSRKTEGIVTQVTSTFNGTTITTEAAGNGRLDAVSNALKKAYELKFNLVTYQEHALEKTPVPKRLPMWEFRNQTEPFPGVPASTRTSSVHPLTHL